MVTVARLGVEDVRAEQQVERRRAVHRLLLPHDPGSAQRLEHVRCFLAPDQRAKLHLAGLEMVGVAVDPRLVQHLVREYHLLRAQRRGGEAGSATPGAELEHAAVRPGATPSVSGGWGVVALGQEPREDSAGLPDSAAGPAPARAVRVRVHAQLLRLPGLRGDDQRCGPHLERFRWLRKGCGARLPQQRLDSAACACCTDVAGHSPQWPSQTQAQRCCHLQERGWGSKWPAAGRARFCMPVSLCERETMAQKLEHRTPATPHSRGCMAL